MVDWDQLIEEHREWAEKNFPGENVERAILGVIEELGELAHAHLKEAQGIRGTPEEHQAEAWDAIGDLTIYLLHVMGSSGIGPPIELPEWTSTVGVPSPERAIAAAANAVGELAYRPSTTAVTAIVRFLQRYCEFRQWDYDEIVNMTWDKVKKRDWQADPVAGGE